MKSRESNRVPWLRLLMFFSVTAGLALAMWKFGQPRTFPAVITSTNTEPAAVASTAAPSSPAPAASEETISITPVAPPPAPVEAAPANPPTPSAPPTLPVSQVPVPDLTSPGVMPGGEAGAKLRSVQQILQGLVASTSIEERLQHIADSATHRDEVAKFFEVNPADMRVTSTDPNVGLFTELPSGNEVKLYVATTSSCPSGAMVRLRSEDGKDKLDWPLFQQTHQLEFDRFVTSASEAPQRFSVLCARSRTSGLSGSDAEAHLAISAQGSLSVRGEAALYVKKSTPAGKFLDSRLVWGRVYLVEMLLEHATVNGKPVLLVQDCAGTPVARR